MSAEREWSRFMRGLDGHGVQPLRERDDGAGVRRIRVEFDHGASAASAARQALVAVEDRLDPAVRDDIRLLVSELVTNSVRHVSPDRADAVGMLIEIDGDKVRVEVTDTGDGFEPKPRTATQSKAGGWGLYLVDRLADRWGVARDAFTRVWFEMDRAVTTA